MDWAKAKNILIAVFFLLNIFLGINLILYYQGDSVPKKNITNTVKILEDRGYVLKCRIPIINKYYMINYENSILDKKAITKKLLGGNEATRDELKNGVERGYEDKKLVFPDDSSFVYRDTNPDGNIEISDIDETAAYCTRFLKQLDLGISSYYLDKYEKKSDNSIVLTFVEKYKGYLIFNNEFTVEVTNKGITGIECKLIKVKGLKEVEGKFVPAYQILLRYFLEGKNTVITGIDIGFKSTYHEKGKSYSTAPIWRVKTGEGYNANVRKFYATDGKPVENIDK